MALSRRFNATDHENDVIELIKWSESMLGVTGIAEKKPFSFYFEYVNQIKNYGSYQGEVVDSESLKYVFELREVFLSCKDYLEKHPSEKPNFKIKYKLTINGLAVKKDDSPLKELGVRAFLELKVYSLFVRAGVNPVISNNEFYDIEFSIGKNDYVVECEKKIGSPLRFCNSVKKLHNDIKHSGKNYLGIMFFEVSTIRQMEKATSEDVAQYVDSQLEDFIERYREIWQVGPAKGAGNFAIYQNVYLIAVSVDTYVFSVEEGGPIPIHTFRTYLTNRVKFDKNVNLLMELKPYLLKADSSKP